HRALPSRKRRRQRLPESAAQRRDPTALARHADLRRIRNADHTRQLRAEANARGGHGRHRPRRGLAVRRRARAAFLGEDARMRVSPEEVQRIAGLAHLAFDDAGPDRMAEELTKILSYIDQLNEVDVRGFEEHSEDTTPMRDDVPRASIDRESV